MGWVSAMLKEPRHDEVAPRLPAAPAMEADMAAVVGQKRRERPIGGPIIAAIEGAGYPRIVHRPEHKGGNANCRHEVRRPAAFVIVLGAGESVARCDEVVVVLPYRTGVQDRAAFGFRDDGALARRLELHQAQDVTVIEPIARTHHVAAGGGEVDRR